MKYEQVWEPANGGFSKWAPFGNEPADSKVFIQFTACCDCGLVHETEMRMRKGILEERVRRRPGLTRKLRAKMLLEPAVKKVLVRLGLTKR